FGLNPTGDSDTQVVLERLGYCLDREHEFLHTTMGPESFLGLEGRALAREISGELDPIRILSKASEAWDGGYVFVGLMGNGDGFVCRDPAGIRPAFYYIDEEVVAAASERAALANVFDIDPDRVEPLAPAHALVVKHDGRIDHRSFTAALPLRSCSFERIYFSRGSDPAIYEERKNLGHALAPRVLASLGGDLEHAVFSYIPNTAEAAYVRRCGGGLSRATPGGPISSGCSTAGSAPRKSPTRTSACARSSRTTRPGATWSCTSTTSRGAW
ncbi:MAG: hypothetical protein ACYTAQ_17140, partial [Planctomycetota bacterium]